MAIELRLSRVLQKEFQRLGSYDRLAEEIRRANSGKSKGTPATVDRRKLKRIIEGTGYSLSARDLEVLDNYLMPLGEGLADRPLLLERKGILDALVASARVTLAFGARPLKDRYYIGLWDVRTSAIVLNAIYRVRPTVIVDIHSAENNGAEGQETVNSFLKSMEGAAEESAKPALCCIGSPRSSPLAEVMLSEMFGVGPESFRRPTPQGKQLPFLFVWPTDSGVDHPPNDSQAFKSRFALGVQDLEDELLEGQVRVGDAYAFAHGDKILPARFTELLSKDYGVVAAQRRQNGQIWLVIAGLSGPGTFAAGSAIESVVTAELPDPTGGEHGQTLYAVVEAEVRNSAEPGEQRQIQQFSLLAAPKLWP